MAEPFVTERRRFPWEQLGAVVAQPFQQQQAQQQALYQALLPVVFKAQIEKQQKAEELAQFPTRLKAIKEALGGQNDVWVKGFDPATGNFELEIKTPKQKTEEQAIQREPQLGSVLSYIQRAAQEGASPKVYREATKKYTTPAEIKSIMSSYETGRKAKPKLTPLGSAQINSMASTRDALSQLDELERVLKTGKVTTGMSTAQALPFGVRAIRGGITGTDEDLQFSQLIRDLQNSYITAKTGAQRGFPEMQFLTIALPGGEMPKEKLLKSIETSRNVMKKNLTNMVDIAERSGKNVKGFTSKIKSTMNTKNYIKTGVNKQGQRVGMLSDGTIEVIQ